MKLTLLDPSATMLTILFGVTILYSAGLNYLLLMLVFLVLGILVTKYEHKEKKRLGIYEHERSWENVLANGTVPVISAIYSSSLGPSAYICSIAAITADKFASELGVLSEEPYSLRTLKKVKKGTSGAISPFGTLMSFDGALLVALSSYLLFPGINFWKVLIISLIGFMGSFIDTLLGVFEEDGIGTKSTTNFICSLTGALIGYLVLGY
ncbi:MAG: DUF92 domain-containing protein [Candidatus Anstonellales archaeon]